MNNKTLLTISKEEARPLIFKNKITDDCKLIPLKVTENTLGKTRHFPSATKEWFNSVYSYNTNYSKNLVSADKSLANILRSYFNLFFKKTALKADKRIPMRYRRLSSSKIFFSRAEIKHTSTKVNITLYVYNEQKRFILRKIRNIENILFPQSKNMEYYSISRKLSLLRDSAYVKSTSYQELKTELMTIAYYKLLLSLNKSKFEDALIRKLKVIVENIYSKEVAFNIVNLKTLYLNSDIFTEVISQKLKKRKNKLLKVLKTSLKLVKIPAINKAKESYIDKAKDMLWLNKAKNFNMADIKLNDSSDALNNILQSILSDSNNSSAVNKPIANASSEANIREIISSLKYKNISGVRLEAKGRLTRRFTASRSLFKVKWKGTLKNMDSSYRALSTVMLRGHVKSNLQYSLVNSKTRNGSFGLKGWISSK